MYQGACLVSVALSIRSRAREYSYHLLRDGRSIGLSFHWRSGSVMRASKRRFCSLLLTSSQILDEMDAAIDDVLLDFGAEIEEATVLFLGAEAHHDFNAGAVVPAAVEDNDLACRREVLHVSLHVHLRLFSIRRRRAARPAEHARTHPLGDGPDGASLAGAVAPPNTIITRRPLCLTQSWSLHSSA